MYITPIIKINNEEFQIKNKGKIGTNNDQIKIMILQQKTFSHQTLAIFSSL